MEATAAVRGGSLSMHFPPQLSRQEWRAVADNHPARDAAGEEMERSKLTQSDERTIYEVQQGRESHGVEFCSISIDGNPDYDILQQRLIDVIRQREDLQQMESELRAQVFARSEILEMQKSFDAQMKEHNDAAIKMQEQLCERDQAVLELEKKIEDKDRELQSIKLDSEAAWAKDDLLREQDKEIATYRRERDHSETERAQQLKHMHEIQEHIHEKERQLLELQEQHRIAQETILYKDEQLREAHAWIARVQEMDALQSTTNHSLQAELRERTEQYNQLWLGCQRQFAEMERLHVHALQQLQLELADARERSGSYNDESNISQTNSKEVLQYGQTNNNQLGGATSTGNNGALSNGSSENVPSFNLTGNSSNQTDHVSGVPMAPSSLLGMPPYLPPGQMAALHPFLMHQPGIPHSVPSQVPQSHMGHFSSLPTISSIQPWQSEQIVSEGSNISAQNELQSSQNVQNIVTSNISYPYEMTANGKALEPDYLDVHTNKRREPDSVLSSSSGETRLESVDRGYQVTPQPDTSLQHVTSQFHDALRLGSTSVQQNIEKDQNDLGAGDQVLEEQGLNGGKLSPAVSTLASDSSSIHNVNVSEMVITNASGSGVVVSEAFVSSGLKIPMMVGKSSEASLLDERALLACVVRTITPGSGIDISSSLPNRLGKMLAPLHWHDYEKKYGKLEDFVAGHPELFVIWGDYIELRKGARKRIAATAAYAKVAAAAAASSHNSSSQNVQNIVTSNISYPYEMTANGKALEPDYLDVHTNKRREPDSVLSSSSGETQLESVDRGYQVTPQPDTSLQHVTSQFHDALRLGSTSVQQNIEKDQNDLGAGDQVLEEQGLNGGKLSPAVSTLASGSSSIHNVNVSEMVITNASGSGVVVSEAFVSSGLKIPMMVGKSSEASLLDERALLACIVRTIPAAGGIHISSTLNRLCMMLAPLHWDDYEKKYGKLEDFVAGHPELFVIWGDYIELRKGARKRIAATAAYAKVAAAAAASSHNSSHLPSVAMTPMAHTNRSKRIPSAKGCPQGTLTTNQPKNGFHSAAGGGVSNVELFTRPKDSRELNISEGKSGESSAFFAFDNGAALDRTSSGSNQGLPSTDGRYRANFSGKHQGRMTAASMPTTTRT